MEGTKASTIYYYKGMQPRDVLIQIQSWVKENPNRKLEVIPIEICTVSDTQEGEDAPATIAGGWIPTPLEPPGPLSLYLWKTDPEFRVATPPVRRTILRDTIITITSRVEAELRGIKWHRKKVIEQIAAQQTSAVSPPMDTPDLDIALCALFGYQKVCIDEANKKVEFFPADPRTWSTDFPVWGATTGSRAVLHRPGEESVGHGLSAWLGDRERDGWKIAWPVSDGTLEEIKKKMLERGTSVGQSIDKPKKAEYAAAWGRAEALRVLAAFD
jgi:hypothetical protein